MEGKAIAAMHILHDHHNANIIIIFMSMYTILFNKLIEWLAIGIRFCIFQSC